MSTSIHARANDPLLIRTAAAPAFVGLPESTFYALAQRPDFPAKVVLGRRTTGYLRAELEASVLAQRREAAAPIKQAA